MSLPLIAAKITRNISGNANVKPASGGLRQNILRSQRVWRTEAATIEVMMPTHAESSSAAGELQVDVLERRPGHGESFELLAAGDRPGR